MTNGAATSMPSSRAAPASTPTIARSEPLCLAPLTYLPVIFTRFAPMRLRYRTPSATDPCSSRQIPTPVASDRLGERERLADVVSHVALGHRQEEMRSVDLTLFGFRSARWSVNAWSCSVAFDTLTSSSRFGFDCNMPTANVTIHRSTSAPRPRRSAWGSNLGSDTHLFSGRTSRTKQLEALQRREPGMHGPQRFTDGDVRTRLDRGLERRRPLRHLQRLRGRRDEGGGSRRDLGGTAFRGRRRILGSLFDQPHGGGGIDVRSSDRDRTQLVAQHGQPESDRRRLQTTEEAFDREGRLARLHPGCERHEHVGADTCDGNSDGQGGADARPDEVERSVGGERAEPVVHPTKVVDVDREQ